MVRPINPNFSPLTKRLVYVNDIWAKYPLEKRREMSKLLKKEGPTFQEINLFETFELMKIWNNIKKELGFSNEK